MENVIVIAVVLIILGLAGFYVYKAKKSGKKCIGCPSGGKCSKEVQSSCGGGCCSCKSSDK